MRKTLIIACVFAVSAAASTIASAQGFGTTGSSGFGRSSFGGGMGSSGFGGMGSSFGSSGFGGGGMGSGMSGFGGMGSGMGGFGGGGLGGGFGNSGTSGGFGNSTFGNQSGFGGMGGGQSFGGQGSTDMSSSWNQMGQAGTQFFNQMNRNMRRDNSNRDDSTAKVENVKQTMRVSLRVAFNTPQPAPDQLANTIRARLGSILADQGIVMPEFTMEGDVAVLRGAAASEDQRQVMERLISLEPGVNAVRNEMTVVPPVAR